jgi:hypothetical protein
MSESRYRVRLLRWSESSSGGRTVTFQLPDDGDEHPFKGLATGKRDGALLEIEVRAADDPEAPLETLKHGPGAAPAAQPAAGPRPRVRRAARSDSGLASERATAAPAHGAATPAASPPDADASEAASSSGTVPSWRSMFGDPPGRAVADEAPAGAGHAATTEGAIVAGAPEPFEPDAALAMQTMAHAALDMRRAAVEIAQDREGRGGGDGDGADDKDGVVERATMLCQEVDHQRAGFFYYMKTRYPTVPELPSEAGQWSRDSNVTRHRVCFHCQTTALAELGLDSKAERRFEDLEADYERTERSR